MGDECVPTLKVGERCHDYRCDVAPPAVPQTKAGTILSWVVSACTAAFCLITLVITGRRWRERGETVAAMRNEASTSMDPIDVNVDLVNVPLDDGDQGALVDNAEQPDGAEQG